MKVNCVEYIWFRSQLARPSVCASDHVSSRVLVSCAAMASVGYQGVPGAYSEAAAMEVFGNANVELVPKGFNSFEDVFLALKAGDIDFAVLP
eukprot:4489156-Pleurochrysis_carterae.AAC.1